MYRSAQGSKNKDVQNVVRQASRLLWPGFGVAAKYLLTTQALVREGQKQKREPVAPARAEKKDNFCQQTTATQVNPW